MQKNFESPTNQIAQEFLDSGSLYHLEAKYLSLVTKAVQESNYSRVLPDRMGCRGKAGKIAAELVIRFLNQYGLVLTCNSFNSEYSKNINRDSTSTLLDIAKLKDKTNPLHELVQIMKSTERHQYHHPKLVQALMTKVPHLLNDETKAHFNKILSRATVAKNNRDKSSKRQGHLEEDISPINKPPLLNSKNALLSPNNQITTKIQQPIVLLDENTDDDSTGKPKTKPQNIMLTLNVNLKNPENSDEQVTLEIEPPSPKPTQITATAVLLPDGEDYQKISSSNGTNQLLNEEEENNEQPIFNNYQNRDIQNINNIPNGNQDDKEYEYEYEYEEIEENEIPNQEPKEEENITEGKKGKGKKSNLSKKGKKGCKSNKKQKKKNSIDPQIQEQLKQQMQLIMQQLQELNQSQQQQQYEQQQKLLQQIQQQELQQQQLQQQLEQQKIQNEIHQQKIQQQLQEQQFQQQMQQEQINQQLQPEPLPKSYRPSPGKFTSKDFSPINVSQTGATSGSSLSFIEDMQDRNSNDASSYIENNVFPEVNKPQLKENSNSSEESENENENDDGASATSMADFIDNEANIQKRNIKPVSNTLDNLLKVQKQAFDDDESSVVIPIDKKEKKEKKEKKKPQLYIETFSMPEVPFHESEANSYTNNSVYSYDSEKSNNTEYSIVNNIIDDIVNNENASNGTVEEEDFEEDIEENADAEATSSQAISVAEKEYPATVIRSIKEAISPRKERQDSFSEVEIPNDVEEDPHSQENPLKIEKEDSYSQERIPKREKEDSYPQERAYSQERKPKQRKPVYLSETDYYSDDYSSYYYSEDGSMKKDDQKQIKFKLRINKEQFERLYPNQNLSNTSTIKVSQSGLKQLQEIMNNQNDTEPLRQVIRLKTPTLQPAPAPTPNTIQRQTPVIESDSRSSPSTISVVTKGPHAGLIKRRIKKTDHQADIQKKLKEKTEYAKKLQEELERRQKETEEAKAKQAANIQMNNKKLVRSQPQTSTKPRKGTKERSASPKYDNDRPSSAPRKNKRKNYKKRDLQFPEEINTSSLILPTISSVSEVHPELMSPKQRYEKKKEIQGRIQRLREELQQPSDPEEKRIRKAKIEAKLRQLKDEFERTTDSTEREVKKPKKETNLKKSPRKNRKQPSPSPKPTNTHQKTKKLNQNNTVQMSSAQKRKRKHEIEMELQRLYNELEMPTYTDEQSQSIPEEQIVNKAVAIPPRRNNQKDLQPQQQQIRERVINPSFSSDQNNNNNQSESITSYNTGYSYSQSPNQQQQITKSNSNDDQILNEVPTINSPPMPIRPPQPKDRDLAIDTNLNNNNDNIAFNDENSFPNARNQSSSLSERRKYNIGKLTIVNNDQKNIQIDDNENSGNNEFDSDREPTSINSDIINNKTKYQPNKINIKKKTTKKSTTSNNNSQVDNENYPIKNGNVTTRQVIDEQIVSRDGKNMIKRKLHIPISHSNDQNQVNQENTTNGYNYNDEDNQYSNNSGTKKETAKPPSKNKSIDQPSIEKDDQSDDGLGQPNKIETLSSGYYTDTSNDNPSLFKLRITVIEAKDVPSLDPFEPCDPYCLLYVDGQGEGQTIRTRSIEKTSHPIWGEEFEFDVNAEKMKKKSLPCYLNILLKDHDVTRDDEELLASGRIDLLNIPVGKVVDDWFQLQNDAADNSYSFKSSKGNDDTKTTSVRSGTSNTASSRSMSNRKKGMIHLKIEKIKLLNSGANSLSDTKLSYSNSNPDSFEVQNGEKLRLNISIVKAEGLSKRNQYIVAKIKNSRESYKTRAINSPEPEWNESFCLKLPNPANDILLITLRNKDPKNGDDDIGNILIPIKSLYPPESKQLVDNWFEFRSTSYSTLKSKVHRSIHSSARKMCGKIHLVLTTELESENASSSNSVTPNASSNNSAYKGSSSVPNRPLILKQAPNSAARHLAVEIVEARGLPSHCSPFCKVQIKGERRSLKTRSVLQDPIPKWNQKIDFYSRKSVEDGILEIIIIDERSNTQIASLSLPLEEMNNERKLTENDENEENTKINQWFQLSPSGEIHLIIIPRMKDTPKLSINDSIKSTSNNNNNNNTRSNDNEQVVLVDASTSDIDIDLQSEGSSPQKKLRRRTRKRSNASYEMEKDEIDSHKKKILDQFPPTTSDEE